jgi:hypothetical protein
MTDLDVAGGRRGVTTKAEEKVCCEVLHCDGGVWLSCKNRSSINLTCYCQYMQRQQIVAGHAHRSDGD